MSDQQPHDSDLSTSPQETSQEQGSQSLSESPSSFTQESRRALTEELHARSILPLYGEYYVQHVALLGGRDIGVTYLHQLYQRVNEPAPSTVSKHETLHVDNLLIRWEQHTEFFSVTVYEQGRDVDFGRARLPLIELAEGEELELIVDMRLGILSAQDTPEQDPIERLGSLRERFSDVSLCGVWISDQLGAYFTDYRLHGADQASAHVLFDCGMTPHQLGRQAVRVIEVETYRVLAMLGYHFALNMNERLSQLESRAHGLITMIASSSTGEERALLDEVITLSMSAEQLIAESSFRLNATRAYSQILFERVASLRGVKLKSLRDLKGFMDRRLTPSMRMVETFGSRLARLSGRLDRSSSLIRTRVDVKLEEQNSALLRSMDRRSKLQLRLQTTVEGLSVIALSYYSLGLIGYLVAPLAKYVDLSPKLIKGGFVLPVVLAVYWFTQRLHSISHIKRPPSGHS